MRFQQTLLILLALVMCLSSGDSLTLQADEVPHASPSGYYLDELALPEIVRFRQLPQRMHLEPAFSAIRSQPVTARSYVAFFVRMLQQADEIEIIQSAAESLARLEREDLEDIEPALEQLRHHLQSSDNARVRYACALAIVAADDRQSAPMLLEALQTGDEPTRLLIEPALAKWQISDVELIWMARLKDRFASTAGYRSAAMGLAVLDHQPAVAILSDTVTDTTLPFSRRAAAAEAVCELDASASRGLAESLLAGNMLEKLICVRLLSAPADGSMQALLPLCSDPSGTVAAAAWHSVLQHQPESLLPILSQGRQHPESGVRMDAANAMRQFPNPERCAWLSEMTGDVHIEVRNVTRACLLEVAQTDAQLHDVIVETVEAALPRDTSSWQQLEQSLVLLCQLQQAQVAAACVPLLQHERAEVAVTAAWAMHLYPDAELLDPAVEFVRGRDGWLNQSGNLQITLDYSDVALQIGFLFQFAGVLRDVQLEEIMDQQFSKTAPGGAIKRAAAMWSLGLLHEDEPENPLAKKFEARMLDTQGLNPEALEVRQASIISVGRLRSVSSRRALMMAFAGDSVDTLIPQSVRWATKLIGLPVPVLPPPLVRTASGFPLAPMGDE